MFEFLLKTTIPVAAGWVTLAFLYDKVYKKLYTDESVYNPTSTGVKKLEKKELNKDSLKGITAAKKNSAKLLDESVENEGTEDKSLKDTKENNQDVNSAEKITTTIPLLTIPTIDKKEYKEELNGDRFKISLFSTNDELAEDELNDETLLFKDDTHDDIYVDSPLTSHEITL